jgi:hypothetical protein
MLKCNNDRHGAEVSHRQADGVTTPDRGRRGVVASRLGAGVTRALPADLRCAARLGSGTSTAVLKHQVAQVAAR